MYNYTDVVLNENIIPKLQEFKNVLKQWQHRKLTLLGKVSVIKTFALPKLIYPLTVLPNPPANILININKPDKVKRAKMSESIENGSPKYILTCKISESKLDKAIFGR